MQRRSILVLAMTGLVAVTGALAHDYQLGTLRVSHPWVRPTAPGQSTGGAYLGIDNRGAAGDRLLGGSTAAAARVEVHEMRMDGNVMRMREIAGIELPAGRAVALAPGGLHLMLVELKAPLKLGDKVPLRLRFEKAGEIEVMLYVESGPAAAAASAHAH